MRGLRFCRKNRVRRDLRTTPFIFHCIVRRKEIQPLVGGGALSLDWCEATSSSGAWDEICMELSSCVLRSTHGRQNGQRPDDLLRERVGRYTAVVGCWPFVRVLFGWRGCCFGVRFSYVVSTAPTD